MPYDVGGITLKSVFKNYTGNELEYCPIIFRAIPHKPLKNNKKNGII